MSAPSSDSKRAPVRIYLVDDQGILRAAMRSLLRADARFEVVGDSGDARVAIDEVGELRPDVVLLDISMPGLSGIDAIAPLKKACPRLHVLMLSHHESENLVDQAMRAGADGYLSKDSDPAELALAVEAVFRNRTYLTPKVAGGLVAGMRAGDRDGPIPAGRLDSLTSREREVLQLLALGRSNKEVARELGVRLGTAKKHRENLQRKLDCHSAAELARLAIREGLVDAS